MADATHDDTQGKRKKTPAQEAGELALCLGVAFLAAVLIKYFLIEMFVIPSGSMEPTLHGREDGGDRVLCTKPNYWFRETGGPKRWETFVFLFPYEQAKRFGNFSHFEGENFIKRCVGLPNETVRILRGDIHITHAASGKHQHLEVKPDPVQRSIWIPVYFEDFNDLRTPSTPGETPDELAYWWRYEGEGDWTVRDGMLHATTPSRTHLAFVPQVRDPDAPDRMRFLKGIPDRYVLRQAVTFECPVEGCDGRLRKTIQTQKIAGRCPQCGRYLRETDAVHYWRRTDLPILDKAAEKAAPEQGEGNRRYIDYHMVPDLRVACRVRPGGKDVAVRFELTDDGRRLQLSLTAGADGRAVLHLAGGETMEDVVQPVAFDPGQWHDIEFYTVDNQARVFVNGAATALIDQPLPTRRGLNRLSICKYSGVMLSVEGGKASFDDLRIDRDIYYLSGRDITERGGPIRVDFLHRDQYRYPRLTPLAGSYALNGDEYMAFGDNSPSSNDSRDWGPVPRENLRGPAIMIWWPLRRIHAIR